MKKIITAILLLTAYVSFGQTPDSISTGKITLGLNFSPDYCFRQLQAGSAQDAIVKNRDSIDIPKFGYTTGVSLLYQLKDRIFIESGIQFSDKGEKTKAIELDPLEPDPLLVSNQVSFKYHYYYLQLPVKVNYMFTSGKVHFFVSSGFSFNFFLNSRTVMKFEGTDKTSESDSRQDISTFNIEFLLGGGIDYSINKRLNIRLEPIYRQSVIPLVDAPVKQYQYSLGANTGVFYKLN
jgi:opacity protein-like surface antigen